MAGGAFTQGVLKALYRGKNRSVCPGCGFPMPKYPGRYPKDCPGCGTPRLKNDENKGSAYDREPVNWTGSRAVVVAGSGSPSN